MLYIFATFFLKRIFFYSEKVFQGVYNTVPKGKNFRNYLTIYKNKRQKTRCGFSFYSHSFLFKSHSHFYLNIFRICIHISYIITVNKNYDSFQVKHSLSLMGKERSCAWEYLKKSTVENE